MKKIWSLASTFSVVAVLASVAVAQDNDRSDRSYSERQDTVRNPQRYSRDLDDRQRDSRRMGRDANSRADSNDSWAEWFSDWWSDDANSGSSGRTSRQQARGNRGLQAFISRHDDDSDGYLSRQELPSNLRDGFDKIDKDSDGYLSQTELRQHSQKAIAQQSPVIVTYVWVLDANQGRVRLNDLQEAYDTLMEVDQDNDGEITRQELRQRQQKIASRWVDKFIEQRDENDDDAVSRQEVQGSNLASRFDQIDRDSDDRLTRSELRQSLQMSGQSSQERGGASESASRERERYDQERR